MKSKQIFFFTTLADIESVFSILENSFAIKYYKTGLLDSNLMPVYKSIFDVPNVGFVNYGDWNFTDSYLMMPKNTSLNIRDISQRNGGVKYAVDQSENSESVVINIGGIYLKGNNVLAAGKMGTISTSTFSDDIYKMFVRELRKKFRKVKTFYVSRQAEDKLKSGWRLVTDDRQTKDYDLRITN